jgi:membrane associated rhomboid family serine protease
MSDPNAAWRNEPSTGPLDRSVAQGLLQRAQTLAEQGDYQLAAQTFARVVGHNDPQIHVAALLGQGEANYRLDNEPAALRDWISATQAPETPLTWMAWKQLAAARVRQGDIAGAARAYREAEKRAPSTERPEIASRLGWLNKEMGKSGTANRYFAKSRTGGVTPPYVTYAILAITVVIGLAELFGPHRLSNQIVNLLALTKTGVEHGEYWRLLTVVLVHDPSSILHLAFNMYALYIIGPIVEALYGRVRYSLIYLVAAAAGSAASFVFSHAQVSVGASGAIFGLFSVLLVSNVVHKPLLTRNARSLTQQIGFLIVINLVISVVVPGIDISAHLGGLVAGAWLGLVIVPKGATLRSFWTPAPGQQQSTGPPVLLQAAGVTVLVAVIAIGVALGPLSQLG